MPPDAPGSKRSQTVSLVLLLGVGAAAVALARRDPSQREEDALIYRDLATCRAQGQRSPEDCEAADRQARALYPNAAPRYATMVECENHHGCGGCVPGASVASAAAGSYLPVLSGFMIGRRPEQEMPAQPLYRHETRACGSHAGAVASASYCTSSGGRVWASGSGSSSARVSSAVARTTTSSPRVVASGGFGATGHAMTGGHGSGGGT